MAGVPGTFLGFRRADGTAGIRNLLVVIPSVVCANTVAQRVAALIPGAVAIPHPHGCAQVGDDVTLTERVLAGAAANPNVGAALIIGLGCETCQAEHVAELARELAPGRPIESFYIQDAGGSLKAISRGAQEGQHLMARIAAQQREPISFSELVVGTKFAGRDGISERASNPTVGMVSGQVAENGGTVIVTQAAGLMVGSRLVQGTLGFAERPPAKGVFSMDTPDHDTVSVSGMAAGGAQVCLFTSGTGTPLGNAIVPVIKVCGDQDTVRRMEDSVDFLTTSIADGSRSAGDLAPELFQLLVDVCNGQLTSAEIIGHQEFAIHRIGPTV